MNRAMIIRWMPAGLASSQVLTILLILGLAVGCTGTHEESENRKRQAVMTGVRFKYDYSGRYGHDGIADVGRAYLDGKLVAEGKALRLFDETPSKLEVEIKHYSGSGDVTYHGITVFVVGNIWKHGDESVAVDPGTPISSKAIKGNMDQIIFSQWPVGQP